MSGAADPAQAPELARLAELVDRVTGHVQSEKLAELPNVPAAPSAGESTANWLRRVGDVRDLHNAKALAAVRALDLEGPRVFAGQRWPTIPGTDRVETSRIEIGRREIWPTADLELSAGGTVRAPAVVPARVPEADSFPVLVQRPRAGEPTGAVVALHGGGFWMGGGGVITELGSQYGAWLADRTGAMVLTPDYRLAPEHPFPRSSADALTVLAWLAERGLPGGRVVLHGISSGGNCAAASAMAMPNTTLDPLAGLVLEAPSLDLPASVQRTEALPGRRAAAAARGRRELLDAWRGEHALGHPLLSPGCVGELTGLAPLLVLLSEQDEVACGGAEFAAAVRAGGGRADVVTRLGTHTITSPAVRAEQWETIADFVMNRLSVDAD